jgi:hypothetical protein
VAQLLRLFETSRVTAVFSDHHRNLSGVHRYRHLTASSGRNFDNMPPGFPLRAGTDGYVETYIRVASK